MADIDGQGAGMSKTQSQTYREKAAECLNAANRTVDPIEKIELLQIAQGYRRLAQHASISATIPTPPKHPSDETT
jgi:hypothetical protein